MNGKFSTEHWENEEEPMDKIVDINGAIKILGITRATLWRWESENQIEGFKAVYRGRLRKCFLVSELKTFAGHSDPVSI